MAKADEVAEQIEYLLQTCDVNSEVDSRLQEVLRVLRAPEPKRRSRSKD